MQMLVRILCVKRLVIIIIQFKDVAMLQMIFNHSSPSITLRYIGIDQDEIDESYKAFEL